jgi:hypothetical protein
MIMMRRKGRGVMTSKRYIYVSHSQATVPIGSLAPTEYKGYE